MKISKRQHNEVIQSLLNRLNSAAELNHKSGLAHYGDAEDLDEDSLGHYTALFDGDRAFDRCNKLQNAMELITEVTGIHHEF